MKKHLVFIISIVLVLLDQFIKRVVVLNINYEEIISFIPNFFYVTYVKNTGGAWSMFSGNILFFIVIGVLAFIGILYYIIKKNSISTLEVIYLGLIMGGMIGNIIDRVFYGGVIDFIGFIFGNYHFPVFNIADICIVIGAVLLVIDCIRGEKNELRSK